MIVEGILASLLVLLVGTLPTWPYSRGWGYSPCVGIGLILVLTATLRILRVF